MADPGIGKLLATGTYHHRDNLAIYCNAHLTGLIRGQASPVKIAAAPGLHALTVDNVAPFTTDVITGNSAASLGCTGATGLLCPSRGVLNADICDVDAGPIAMSEVMVTPPYIALRRTVCRGAPSWLNAEKRV